MLRIALNTIVDRTIGLGQWRDLPMDGFWVVGECPRSRVIFRSTICFPTRVKPFSTSLEYCYAA